MFFSWGEVDNAPSSGDRGNQGGGGAEMGFFFYLGRGTSYLFVFNSMVCWEYVICRRFPALFFSFSFVSCNLFFPLSYPRLYFWSYLHHRACF